MLINFGNGNRGPGGRRGSGGVTAILLREMFVKKEKNVWHLPYYADRVARPEMYKNIYISKSKCLLCSGYIVSNSINYTRPGLIDNLFLRPEGY